MSDFNFSTAAVSWDGPHLRIYTSNGQTISEKCWDSNSWYVGALSCSGQTVGATSWLDSNNQIHIRVYASDNGQIVEHCWDKDKWYIGALSCPGTMASATATNPNNQLVLRVYVTLADGKVQEQCWDGSGPWYVGAYE